MKFSSDAFVVGKDAPVVPVGDGIERQVLGYTDALMVIRVRFAEGAEGYVHAHPHAQVSYVESGEFQVLIDGERKLLAKGDSFCVQPNLYHGAVCRKAGVLLEVFSPVREDFLGQEESS
ncbi:MAG: cupin domain-containing protein [Pseudomonadota bacterium]